MGILDRIRGREGKEGKEGKDGKKEGASALKAEVSAKDVEKYMSRLASMGLPVGGLFVGKNPWDGEEDDGALAVANEVAEKGKAKETKSTKPTKQTKADAKAEKAEKVVAAKGVRITAAQGRLQERREEREKTNKARRENAGNVTMEELGGVVIDEPVDVDDAPVSGKDGGRGRGGERDGDRGGDIERKNFDTVRIVRDKRQVRDTRATDMSTARGGSEDDGEQTGVTVLRDVVAEHLIDYMMDPLDKNLPIVTILPQHALMPIVSAETMATLPYRQYLGNDPTRRGRSVELAKKFNAPLFLIKRRDIRSMGVKGQARADGISLFQIRQDTTSDRGKPLFPSE